MTEKQEKILKAALELFATQGFAATSTAKVAKKAGVSEGLIFRHFENKQGLLEAIMHIGKEKAKEAFAEVVMANEPKECLRKALELPFTIPKSDYELWRLTYALKWQMNNYDDSFSKPVKLVLINAFTELGYSDPEAEADLLLMYIDGMATALLLHEPENKTEILSALKAKYQL